MNFKILNHYREEDSSRSKSLIVFLFINSAIVFFLLILAPFVSESKWTSSNYFHSFIEIASGLIALIGGVACLVYSLSINRQIFLVIGLGFFVAGCENLIQGIFFFDRFFPDNTIYSIRYVTATDASGDFLLALFTIIAFSSIKINIPQKHTKIVFITLCVSTFIVGISAAISAYFIPISVMIHPSKYISRPFDFITAIMFMAAFILIFKKYLQNKDAFTGLISICLLINSGGHFYISFSKSLYDACFDFAHILFFISYLMPAIGITIQSINEMKEKEIEIEMRKMVEAGLFLEKKKFETIAENISIGISILSKDYEVLWANKFLKSIFGEIENKKCYIAYNRGKRNCKACKIKDVFMSGKEKIINEFKGRDIYGNTIWNQFISTPIKDSNGNFSNVMQAVIPITAKKKTELKLKESEERLFNFLNSAVEGFALLDNKLNVVEVNKAMVKLCGAPERNELIGKNISEISSDINFKIFSDQCFNAIKTGSPLEIEDFTVNTIHGKLNVAVSAFKTGHGLGMIARDISEEKRIKHELIKAKEEAEAANKTKSAFLANMSHELRTPMNAIIGIPGMLLKYNTDNLTEKQREGCRIIRESGQKLLTLINNILDLSKIEAGAINVNLGEFSILDLIDDLEIFVKSLIESKKIEFIIKKHDGIPELIISDALKINQILINILGNAVKFTETGKIILSVYTDLNHAYFEIEDTGIGIEKKYINYVFDEFRQIDSSSTRKHTGTGLGLAISKKMVELLNGKIEIHSKVNIGTRIKFSIPILTVNKKEQGEESEIKKINPDFTKSTGNNISKILVADDEKIGRATIKMMLEEKYTLIFANNGHEAIEKFKSEKPDIILMDIMMPEMDGFKTFDEIRKTGQGKKIPIIALTARAMKEERENIINYGFDNYISKPIDDELLINTIEKLLKNKC